MNYNYKKIGNRIYNERINAGIKNQDNFLEKLNYSSNSVKSRQTVGKWENGKQMPNLDIFLQMCKLFNCELGYLLCEYDCKTRKATDIHETTGLSEKAINTLENINHSSNYKIISALNSIIEHSLFEKLLQAIQEYIETFYIRESQVDDNSRATIANYMHCKPNDIEKYMEIVSKDLILDIVNQIISDLDNQKKQLSKYSRKLFTPED